MKRFSNFILAAMVVITTVAVSSQAALNSYMWIKDDMGVDIKGSVDIAGREGSVEVMALDHNVYTPIDPITKQPTGTRKHDPFVFTKNIDASTPFLYKAVCEGQTFKQVVIKNYQIDYAGIEKEYYTCVLEGVKVVKVAPALHNVFNGKKKAVPMEEITFTYTKVTWTYLDGNIQWSDSPLEGR